MRRIPQVIDLSLLEFLTYGDIKMIADEDRKEDPTRKTHPNYVGEICKGLHRNDRILKKAFKVALKRKSEYPMQAIKPH